MNYCDIMFKLIAAVVELADTRDLKSLGVKSVPVQVRSAAPANVERPFSWDAFFIVCFPFCTLLLLINLRSFFNINIQFSVANERVISKVASSVISDETIISSFSASVFTTYRPRPVPGSVREKDL